MKLIKIIKDFFNKKQVYVKVYSDWLNYSIWNRAIFVYTAASFSVFVRYVLYSVHNGFWLPNSLTLYSAFFSYTVATFFLLLFGVLRNITLSDYMKKFIDIDRIRENRIRNQKFMELVAETHNAHSSFKFYSYNPFLIFGISFFLVSWSSNMGFGVLVSSLVSLYGMLLLINLFYFARCIYLTPVPEDLKTIRPAWLVKLNNFNDNLTLMNGVANAVTESATGSGLGKRILNKISSTVSRSFNYATDTKNARVVISSLALASSVIVGVDYTSAEASQRTSYLTRVFEFGENGTYSTDPDTRSKAAALRRKRVDLLDCCESNSCCLDAELVENKYEMIRPYETNRYLILEQEKAIFEQKATALEQKATALEEENRKLRLNLEISYLE